MSAASIRKDERDTDVSGLEEGGDRNLHHYLTDNIGGSTTSLATSVKAIRTVSIQRARS
jgi:hypothetical protein